MTIRYQVRNASWTPLYDARLSVGDKAQAPKLLGAAGDKAVQIKQGLHRAFAEGGLTDNNAAVVILDGAGKDL